MKLRCSEATYRKILKAALRSGYRFLAYDEILREENGDARAILLRHDVDYSIELAGRIAEINAESGIVGTFFVQLRTPVYNLLNERNLKIIERIAECGQKLGLHHAYPAKVVPAEKLKGDIERDLKICELETGQSFERVVAWHNPRSEIIDSPELLSGSGFFSAYDPPFFREGHYFSDSNLRNGPEDFLQILGSRDLDFLRLLLHPVYWIIGGDSVKEILAGTMQQVIRENEREFHTNPNWEALPLNRIFG